MNETAYALTAWAIVIIAIALMLVEHFIDALEKDTYEEHSDYTVKDFYSITKKD